MILGWIRRQLRKRTYYPTRPVVRLVLEELEDRIVPDANPLMQWSDQGIVYTAPASGDAYYPSVDYDAAGFGGGDTYRMWYSDGTDGFLTTSSDGINWDSPSAMTGLVTDANHIQVIYDVSAFGGSGITYKAWYWDATGPYPDLHIEYAESTDGINWTSAQTITQNPAQPLVTGVSSDWNTGSYGPIDIHYQSAASNTGSNPWDYSYVMYYDGTNGNNEYTGLAYSTNGTYWNAYPTGSPGNPVLQGGAVGSWDSVSAAYGTVIQQSSTSYVYFYSGGDGTSPYGSAVSQGIGLATSTDGITWTKNSGNPIFDIDQGVSYRNHRVYTPEVITDADGHLRMYYSAVGTDGIKKIGLAMGDYAPTVTLDPTGQTVVSGANTSFSAAATDGLPIPTTVQWQVSTDGGITFSNLSEGGVYSGVTSTTLTIIGASVSMNGYQYRAVFSNAADLSDTTTAATLTVNAAASSSTTYSAPCIDLQAAYTAYVGTYYSYVYAYHAYATGQGSYAAYNYAYVAFYFSYWAYAYGSVGQVEAARACADYARTFSGAASAAAAYDYAHTHSVYSWYAWYFGVHNSQPHAAQRTTNTAAASSATCTTTAANTAVPNASIDYVQAYYSYVNAYYAYATGQGSHAAYAYAFTAFYYAYWAQACASAGQVVTAQIYATYAQNVSYAASGAAATDYALTHNVYSWYAWYYSV